MLTSTKLLRTSRNHLIIWLAKDRNSLTMMDTSSEFLLYNVQKHVHYTLN